MTAALPNIKLSVEEYLDLERTSDVRHEYHDGEVFAMSGAKPMHNLIIGNLWSAVKTHLQGNACRVFSESVKLYIGGLTKYVYPDLFVFCGQPEHIINDTVNDATVIIEVLSESTEGYDRGDKFRFYQRLPSLQEYVLVAQDKVSIELYRKEAERQWRYTVLDTPEMILELATIGLTMPLSAIYDAIDF